MIHVHQLIYLQRALMQQYLSYERGDITEEEYLIKIKPIDLAIGQLEMAILRDTLVWKESFLQHTLKLKC